MCKTAGVFSNVCNQCWKAQRETKGNWQVLGILQFNNILMDFNGDTINHTLD